MLVIQCIHAPTDGTPRRICALETPLLMQRGVRLSGMLSKNSVPHRVYSIGFHDGNWRCEPSRVTDFSPERAADIEMRLRSHNFPWGDDEVLVIFFSES